MSYINPISPINWSHPLNKGLVFDTTILSNTGWTQGSTVQNIVRRGHKTNDGLVYSGVTWQKTGPKPNKFGSLLFDGATGVIDFHPPAGPVNVTGDMAVAFWIKSNDAPTTGTDKIPIGMDSYPTGNRGWTVYMSPHTSGVDFGFDFFVPQNANSSIYFNAQSELNGYYFVPNVWYYVVCDFVANVGVYVFVNGVLVAIDTTGIGGLPNASSNPGNSLAFGRRASGASTSFFNGYLANVQIYNRYKLTAEIQRMYREECTGNRNRLNWINSNIVSQLENSDLISTYKTNNNIIVSSARLPTSNNYVNPNKPINWSHPLNRGLIFDTTILPNSGWGNNRVLRDIVRKLPLVNTSTTLVGGPGSCIGMKGVHYDGSVGYSHLDFYSVPGNFQDNTAWSIGFWFRGTTDQITLFGTYNGYNNGNQGWIVEIGMGGVSGSVVGSIGMDLINDNASLQRRAGSNKSVIDGKWHHCVCTYSGIQDNSGFSFYVDGVKGSTIPAPGQNNGPGTLANNTLWLGRWAFAYSAFDLAGLQFYNYVLTDSTVAKLYREQRLGRPNTLQWIKPNSGSKYQSSEIISNATTAGYDIVPKASAIYVNPSKPINWSNPLNRGLVSDWTILPNPSSRGGPTLRDIVRGGHLINNGTLVASQTWVGPSGRQGSYGAISNTTGRISVSPPNWIGTGPFTIVCWLKRNTAGTRGDNFGAKDTGDGNPDFGFFVNSTDKLWLYTYGGLPDTNYVIGSTSIGTAWTHCVGTRDGSGNMKVYVNGILDGSASVTATNMTGFTNANIFDNGVNGAAPFSGLMDGMQLYNRELTAQQIAQLYQEQRLGRPNTLQWVGNTNNITSSSNQLINSNYFTKQAVNRASTF